MRLFFHYLFIVFFTIFIFISLSSFCGGDNSNDTDFGVSYIQLIAYPGSTNSMLLWPYPYLIQALLVMKQNETVGDASEAYYSGADGFSNIWVKGWGAAETDDGVCADDIYRDEIDFASGAFFYSQDFNLSGTQTVQTISQCEEGKGIYAKGTKLFSPQQWPTSGNDSPVQIDEFIIVHSCIDDDGEYGCFKEYQ